MTILYISNNFQTETNHNLLFPSILVLIITIIIFVISTISILNARGMFVRYQNFILNIPIIIITLGVFFHIINFNLIFPNLDYFYPSKTIANKIEKIKHGSIASAGYHEPSLVFMLNGNVLLSNPNEVAIFMAEGSNNIGLIEDSSLNEFLDSTKDLNLEVTKNETIEGFNIAKGKHIKIHVFTNQTFDQSN